MSVMEATLRTVILPLEVGSGITSSRYWAN